MRTPRLPVVYAPADLYELVRFAERRNLVSALVPSHFNWPLRQNTLIASVVTPQWAITVTVGLPSISVLL